MIDFHAASAYTLWAYFASMMIVLAMVIRHHGFLEEIARRYVNDELYLGVDLSDRAIYLLTALIELLLIVTAPWVLWQWVSIRISAWRGRRARLRETRAYTTTFDTDRAAMVYLVLSTDEASMRRYFGGEVDATEPVSVLVSPDDAFDSIVSGRVL